MRAQKRRLAVTLVLVPLFGALAINLSGATGPGFYAVLAGSAVGPAVAVRHAGGSRLAAAAHGLAATCACMVLVVAIGTLGNPGPPNDSSCPAGRIYC